jgi:hypothetical protein
MQFPSCRAHITRACGIVEREQLQTQLAGVFRLYPGFRSRPKELLQARMAKALDHNV